LILCKTDCSAADKRTTHPRVAGLARTDVRVAARRTVRRNAQAWHRLRDTGPHGVQRLHRVGAGNAGSGRHRATAPNLSADGARRANASGMGDVYTRSGMGGEAMTPGTWLLKIAPLIFNQRFIALVVRPEIPDPQSRR